MKKIFLTKNRNAFNMRWVCDFGSKLAEKGYDVSVVCDEKNYDPNNDVPIDSRVKKTNLGEVFSLFAPLKFLKHINKENPDIVFAYFLKDLLNLSLCLNKTKVVMMFHNVPKEVFQKNKNPIMRWIYKKLLKKTSCIQVLMPEFIQEVYDIVGKNANVVLIPNQVMIQEQSKDYAKNTKTIIYVGQIAEHTKRQHLLIEAFSKIAHKHPDWVVHLFGKIKKGKHTRYYKKCIKQIKSLGLEKQILFMGYSKQITQELLNSEIATLPSRAEGFGYGLADGLALGLPGVGFAGAAGINDILIDGKSGFLVKNVDDYANKLDILMSNDKIRQEMGVFGRKDMQKRYNPKEIINKWVKLIEEA